MYVASSSAMGSVLGMPVIDRSAYPFKEGKAYSQTSSVTRRARAVPERMAVLGHSCKLLESPLCAMVRSPLITSSEESNDSPHLHHHWSLRFAGAETSARGR